MDEKRLRQVIFNLLGNAIKFTKQGKVTLIVKCPAWNQDKITLYVEVADTGIGIAQAQQTKIFEAFERASEKRLYSHGMGLGLTMSYQLIQLMKGNIEVESTPGQGSRFWVTVELPVIESNTTTPVTNPKEIIAINTKETKKEATETEKETEEIEIPPRSQLESLHELAIVGKIFQIRAWVTEMRECDATTNQYTVFLDKIEEMAKKFQIKQITMMVKKYLATND
jgi:DNA topoisomerase VI subunit B